ncbi:MAG: thioredoxin family protein [Planctomycetota bacterium]
MDRSFLSNASIVEASRNFVCIRLSTYESVEEAEILKSFFIGRSGELENTTFVLLSSDGKQKLTRAGRSPEHIFRGGTSSPQEQMAQTMTRISKEYLPRKQASGEQVLPKFPNFRLALNVAACDNLPLLVSLAPEEKTLALLEKQLPLWNPEFLGQFLYVSVSDIKELAGIEGEIPKSGLLWIRPGSYGLDGRLLGSLAETSSTKEIESFLSKALSAFRPEIKDHRQHVQKGHQIGIYWKTLIPDTDPGPLFGPR